MTDLEDVMELANGLNVLKRVQDNGASLLPTDTRVTDQENFRTAALAMFVELGELVNECQWKPWRDYRRPTDSEKQKILKEMADVLHMWAWMANALEDRFGLDGAHFAAAFIEVAAENRRRFRGEVPGREPPVEVRS